MNDVRGDHNIELTAAEPLRGRITLEIQHFEPSTGDGPEPLTGAGNEERPNIREGVFHAFRSDALRL